MGCLRAVKIIEKTNLELLASEGNGNIEFIQRKMGIYNSAAMENKEIQILRQVDHPGIMRMFEYFEDDTRYYIISDYYQGGELYDFIRDHIDR